MATIFEYQYRDGSNYKSHGEILLSGDITASQREEALDCLESSEFFVAEQLGIPSLYHGVWAYGGGPTHDDHAYHEFVDVRVVSDVEVCGFDIWGSVEQLLIRLQNARGRWRCDLSPCCFT